MRIGITAKGVTVGVCQLPGKKKPHIFYSHEDENVIYDCGKFTNEESAERFMTALKKLTGAVEG